MTGRVSKNIKEKEKRKRVYSSWQQQQAKSDAEVYRGITCPEPGVGSREQG